jgi:hypothetical protein
VKSLKSSKKNKKTFQTILMIVSIFALVFVAGAGVSSTIMIANTPADIVPTNIASNPITMNVYRTDDTPLEIGIVADVNGKATYIDPDSVYAPIQAQVSDTWLSDVYAVPIPDQYAPAYQQSYALPIYDGDHVFTVEMVYHYIVWTTVEVVIRTGPANKFAYTPSTNYVSPFKLAVIHGQGDIYKDFSAYAGMYNTYASETQGALTMWQHYSGTWPNQIEFQTNTMKGKVWGSTIWRSADPGEQGPYAAITTSILPHAIWSEMLVDSPSYTDLQRPEDVIALKNMASAQPVRAEVTVHIDANSQQIETYNNEFQYTLADGTVARVAVDTVSAAVGFSGYPDGLRSTGEYVGIIPNTNPLHQVPDFGLINITSVLNDEPDNDAISLPAVGTPTVVGSSIDLYGWIEPTLTSTQELYAPTYTIGEPRGSGDMHWTGANPGGPGAVLDITPEGIDRNCGMQDTLDITATNTLGPKLTAYNTIANLRYQEAWEDYYNFWWQRVTYTYLQWCYGLQVDNVMTAQNFTFPVDIVSERSVQLFSSDGAPIDLTAIVDTDMNAIFNDPRLDTIHVKQSTPILCNFNLLDANTWLSWIVCSLGDNIWWVVAVLIVIVFFIGLWLFGKITMFFAGLRNALKRTVT